MIINVYLNILILFRKMAFKLLLNNFLFDHYSFPEKIILLKVLRYLIILQCFNVETFAFRVSITFQYFSMLLRYFMGKSPS